MRKISRLLMMVGAIILFGLLMALQQGIGALWLRVLVGSLAGCMLGVSIILAQTIRK